MVNWTKFNFEADGVPMTEVSSHGVWKEIVRSLSRFPPDVIPKLARHGGWGQNNAPCFGTYSNYNGQSLAEWVMEQQFSLI